MKTTMRAALVALSLVTATLLGGAGTLVAAGPAVAAPMLRTVAPSTGELQAKLQLALNTGASRSARANELENGEAGLGLLDRLGGVIASVPGFGWYVSGPVSQDGDTLSANMITSAPGFGSFPPIEISWRDIDGTWKLTTESQCTLAYYASLSC